MKRKKLVKKKTQAKRKPAIKVKTSRVETKARRYEGAAKGKRLSRWSTPSTGPNDALKGGLVALRNRARDLRRNNPYASKAIQVISANVVGIGIQTQFRGDNAEGLETQWKQWAETKAIDFDGRHNIYGLQRLIMEAVAESGEVLIRRRINSRLSFPVQYQVLESDFLDTTKTQEAADGNYIIQGIEFDKQGRRVAYHLYEVHPGETADISSKFTLKSNRISADEIKHVYRQDRPGQARGVSWFAPVIVRLKDLDDYEDAQLLRQKIAACFTAFVGDLSADVTDEDEDCDPLSERIEPGLIEMLPPGKTIEFAKPPEVIGYTDYVASNLHAIAAGIGLTYEALTGDLSRVNFSSARLGWLEFGRNLKVWREHVMISAFMDPVADEFMLFSSIKGAKTDGTSFVHVAPSREMIDPTKEVPATVQAIKAGLTTLSDEIMALGKDPEAQLEQYKKDMDKLDQLELKLESDPRNEIMPRGRMGARPDETENQNPET